jgi:hypothetical protein
MAKANKGNIQPAQKESKENEELPKNETVNTLSDLPEMDETDEVTVAPDTSDDSKEAETQSSAPDDLIIAEESDELSSDTVQPAQKESKENVAFVTLETTIENFTPIEDRKENISTVTVEMDTHQTGHTRASLSKIVKVLIKYPQDFMGVKYFTDGEVKEVSVETADIFIEKGIATLVNN